MTNSFRTVSEESIFEFSFDKNSSLFESFIEYEIPINTKKNEYNCDDVFCQKFKDFVFNLNPHLFNHIDQVLSNTSFDIVYKHFIDTLSELALEEINTTKFKQAECKRIISMVDFLKINDCTFLKVDDNTLFFFLS
jgi:hypothetical protein